MSEYQISAWRALIFCDDFKTTKDKGGANPKFAPPLYDKGENDELINM